MIFTTCKLKTGGDSRSHLRRRGFGGFGFRKAFSLSTPCIRPPCHDVVHITDGAVPEEGFVGCAQHPQSIALSLGHQTTLSNMHSWL